MLIKKAGDRHEVPLWRAGERPRMRMRQTVVEGDAGLAV